jgi:hypothetical protein
MKKFFKGIGDSIGILLILFLIVGMFEPKKTKRFKWRYVLIFIALFFLGWQMFDSYRDYQNKVPDHGCMPATLQRIFPNHTVREMVNLCKTTDVGTPLENIFPAWKALSTNELVIEYSALEQYKCENETILKFGVPYLWVGVWDSGHVALVSFETNKVTFSHSQFYDGTTNYVVVDMDWATFFSKTYVVFSSPEFTNKPIRLR